jgi:hypothetical protein
MSKAIKALEMTPHQAACKIAPIFVKKGWTWGFTDAKGGFRAPTALEIERVTNELLSDMLLDSRLSNTSSGRLTITRKGEKLFLSVRGAFEAKLKGYNANLAPKGG